MQGGKIIDKIIYPELSYKIVGILFEVYNELGYGYKELYYQNALKTAFKKAKVKYKSQAPYRIKYRNEIIGRNYIDFILDNRIVLEIKRGDHFSKSHFTQVYQYLVVTNLSLGILANFSPTGIKYKRVLNIK